MGYSYTLTEFMRKENTNMAYLDDILKIGATLKPGTVNHLFVEHEDNCKIWKTGECTCNPGFSLLEGKSVRQTPVTRKTKKKRR